MSASLRNVPSRFRLSNGISSTMRTSVVADSTQRATGAAFCFRLQAVTLGGSGSPIGFPQRVRSRQLTRLKHRPEPGRVCGPSIRKLPVVPQEHKSDALGMRRRGIARSALIGGFAVVLAGCTPTVQPGDRTTVSVEASKSSTAGTELMGQGTVLQRRPAEPEFCLGYIATSDPPRCSGPVIHGWNWDSVTGSTTVGTVTHGDYLLQ